MKSISKKPIKQKEGEMVIDGALIVSSESPKGIFRPYGMAKWLDEYKLNLGVVPLYVSFNDIYLDIQSKYYEKDKELTGTPYLKLFWTKWFFGVRVMEFLEDERWVVYDSIARDLYFRLPRTLYPVLGRIFTRKYVTIVK